MPLKDWRFWILLGVVIVAVAAVDSDIDGWVDVVAGFAVGACMAQSYYFGKNS